MYNMEVNDIRIILEQDLDFSLLDDSQLLEVLRQLGVGDHYRVLALLPMLLVAWTDGKIHTVEREEIMKIAKEHNYVDEQNKDVLEAWLQQEPTPFYYKYGIRALVELARRHQGLGSAMHVEELRDIHGFCIQVGQAAHHFWEGDAKLSLEEDVALDALRRLLNVDDGDSWAEILAELG
jgi:uncharacterized tellurite resistance protein B-like protein